jgi:hypothetical protein
MLDTIKTWAIAHQILVLSFGFAFLGTLLRKALTASIYLRDLQSKTFWKVVQGTNWTFVSCAWTSLFLQLLGWDFATAICVMPVLLVVNWIYTKVLFLIHFHMLRDVLGFSVAVIIEHRLHWIKVPESVRVYLMRDLLWAAVGFLLLVVFMYLLTLFTKAKQYKSIKEVLDQVTASLREGVDEVNEPSLLRKIGEFFVDRYRRLWLFLNDIGGKHFFGGGRLLEYIAFKWLPW